MQYDFGTFMNGWASYLLNPLIPYFVYQSCTLSCIRTANNMLARMTKTRLTTGVFP